MAERKKSASSKKTPTRAVAMSRTRAATMAKEPSDGCDVCLRDMEVTPDEDLPAAQGGVA